MGQQESMPIFNLKIATAKEGKKLLDEAESIDNYRGRIAKSEVENKARSSHNYFPLGDSQFNKEETQNWLDSFCMEITQSKEYRGLSTYFIRNKINIYIVNLQFSADGGMPHTRPLSGNRGLICFPGGLRLSNLEKKTLVHELIHVSQRFNNNWFKVYEKKRGRGKIGIADCP